MNRTRKLNCQSSELFLLYKGFLKNHLSERQGKRGHSHMLGHMSNAHNCWSWVRLKPGAGNSIQISTWTAEVQLLESSSLPSLICFSSQLESGTRSIAQTQAFKWDAGFFTAKANAFPPSFRQNSFLCKCLQMTVFILEYDSFYSRNNMDQIPVC